MSDWRAVLLENVCKAIRVDGFWRQYLRPLEQTHREHPPFSVHLGIFNPPYLDYILEGRKTVESRFSMVRCAPFDRVRRGDVLLLKPAGGPIVGLCLIDYVWFYNLDLESWRELRRTFTDALCAQDPHFWKAREHAAFATLMRVTRPSSIPPVECAKRDRRGWVVVKSAATQAALQL